MKENRLDFLDSSRGILALVVLFFHTNDFIYFKLLDETTTQYLLQSRIQFVLNVVFNGGSAVSYFFVLSGFVLSYVYFKKGIPIDLVEFITKRAFRIFPLYCLVICSAFAFNYSTTPLLAFSKEILLLPNIHTLVPPGWSMTIELCISFLVPMLAYLARNKFNWFLVLCPLLVLMSNLVSIYFMHFMLGILLSRLYCLRQAENKMKRTTLFMCLSIAFILLSVEQILSLLPKFSAQLELLLSFINMKMAIFVILCAGIGATLLIQCIFRTPTIQKFLSHPLLLFTGKISYGIYLIHWIVLYHLVNDRLLFLKGHSLAALYFGMWVSVACITLALSFLLYHFVELPFIGWGKTAAKSISTHCAQIRSRWPFSKCSEVDREN